MICFLYNNCLQVDLNDESASYDVVCSAMDSFVEECRPFLSGSVRLSAEQERTPRTFAATRGPFADFHSVKPSTTSVDIDTEDATESSPLTKNYIRFINSISLVKSKELDTQSFCSSLTPADIQFRSTESSFLTADQKASNIVQIAYKHSESFGIQDSGTVKNIRKISSLPISLASFSFIVRVKDFSPDVVTCVELSLSKPGSNSNSRYVFVQALCILEFDN